MISNHTSLHLKSLNVYITPLFELIQFCECFIVLCNTVLWICWMLHFSCAIKFCWEMETCCQNFKTSASTIMESCRKGMGDVFFFILYKITLWYMVYLQTIFKLANLGSCKLILIGCNIVISIYMSQVIEDFSGLL